MAPSSNPGILHQYVSAPPPQPTLVYFQLIIGAIQAPKLAAFEYTSTLKPKPHSLLFIGGLSDGLYTVPYVSELAKALELTDWSVFWLLLSSSYNGWGVGSLNQDAEEIAQCVRFVREYKSSHAAQGKVVIMGHSTGSQDVLHYLYAPNPLPRDLVFEKELQHLVRPEVDGAILQAPVSDREFMVHTLKTAKASNEVHEAYEQWIESARRQPYEADAIHAIMPAHLVTLTGLPDDVPISARRFLSLVSPDSPEKPSDDDLFSSDLKDERLHQTFGAIVPRGLLRSSLLVLYSGGDEFVPDWVNKEQLVQRWKEAANASGRSIWNENSGVIQGARHNVKDVGQEDLIARVTRYLSGLVA